MFSVNIDKIVKVSTKEEKNLTMIVNKILENDFKTIAVVNGGVDSVKFATVLSYPQNKTLFIDGDFRKGTFLGKYKLGKNIKGIADAFTDVSVLDDNICVTNNPYVDILFTGDIDKMEEGHVDVSRIMEKIEDNYEYIVIDSDEDALIASACDVTVVMCDEKSTENGKSEEMVAALDEKGCFVLGVIIND